MLEFGEETYEDRQLWWAKNEKGGIHIWSSLRPSPITGEIYGGIEVHSPVPLYTEPEPTHAECWLIDGPCYHCGSSLYFEERIKPILKNGHSLPEEKLARIRTILTDWHNSYFGDPT